MERLKKSKTVLWLIELFKVRPIVIAGGIVILLDILYVNLIFNIPKVRGKDQNVTVSGKISGLAMDADGSVKSLTVGNTLCYVNKIPGLELSPGNTVSVRGRLSSFDTPMNPGEFDMQKYYASKKIWYCCYADNVKITDDSVSMKAYFLRAAGYLSKRVLEYCPLEGGTVNTLLLADKNNLDEERKKVYMQAGVSHFLVISGLHISAVGAFVYLVMKRTGMKRSYACIAAMGVVFLYGLMVGFSVSVIRALIMYSLRLFADVVKRVYDMMNAVAFAAIVTIIINPYCIWDSAFIYSYVTVFTIALYLTYIHPKAYRRDSPVRFLREAVRIPAVLALFILPVTLTLSYRFSFLSIFVNAVLAPLSAGILLLGFFCLGFSVSGWSFLSGLFDFLLHLVLSVLDKLCEIASNAPFFAVSGKPPVLFVALYYVFLIAYFCKKEEMSPYKRVFCITNILLLLSTPLLYIPSFSALYVGQGECLVLQSGPKSAVMVDCGSSDKKDLAKYTVVPCLKAMGIQRIDSVFVSHPDFDHCGAIPELISEAGENGIEIKRVIFQNASYIFSDEIISNICRQAKAAGIKTGKISAGQKRNFGAFSFTCLWPLKSEITGDTNHDSMVLLASFLKNDCLLTGDITADAEEKLIEFLHGKDIEVLKISHHGSKSSSTEAFLREVSPDIAVISAGINNRYGHPDKETLGRIKETRADIFCTSSGGRVLIRFWKN